MLYPKFRQNWKHIHDLVQDCSDSSALALELLQSYAKSSIWVKLYAIYQNTIFFRKLLRVSPMG